MDLIDNNKYKLLKIIKQCLVWSEKVDVAVAFVRNSGVIPITEPLKRIQNEGGQVRVLAGLDFGFTEPDALSALQYLGVKVRVFSGTTIFHPKCYLFQRGNTLKAIVGSSNLTSSGLESGIEWNVFLDSEQENDLNELTLSYEKLWYSEHSRVLSEDILAEMRILHKEIQNETSKRKILRKLDYTTESIQFPFTPGKAFFDYSHHPITIPKNRWNNKLKVISSSKNCEILIDFTGQKYHGDIYTSEAGYGQFYQLRFDRYTSREVAGLFEANSTMNVESCFRVT
jgi:HKD family nuclease